MKIATLVGFIFIVFIIIKVAPRSFVTKALIIVGVLLLIWIVMMFFVLRRKNTDISNEIPYVEVVNKTYKTKQICYIDKDVLKSNKESFYFLTMDKDGGGAENFLEIPVGTKINLIKAIASYSGTSGSTSTSLKGTIYINEIASDVKFYFYWKEKEYHSDSKYYSVFKLAPWQEKELPYKFDLDGNKIPYDKSKEDKLIRISDNYWNIYHKAAPNIRHIYEIDSIYYLENTIEPYYKFKHFTNAIDNLNNSTPDSNSFCLSKEEIEYLNLKEIYSNLEKAKIFPLSKFEAFKAFNSFLFAYVIKDEILETRIINFSKNREIIDHIVIYKQMYNEDKPSIFTTGDKYSDSDTYNIKGKNIKHEMLNTKDSIQKQNTIFKIEENGKISIKQF